MLHRSFCFKSLVPMYLVFLLVIIACSEENTGAEPVPEENTDGSADTATISAQTDNETEPTDNETEPTDNETEPTDNETEPNDGGIESTDTETEEWTNSGCDAEQNVVAVGLELDVEVDLTEYETGKYTIRESITLTPTESGNAITLFGERFLVSYASAGFSYNKHVATFCTEPFDAGDQVTLEIEFTTKEQTQATLPLINWGLRRHENEHGIVVGPFNEPYYAVNWIFVPQSLNRTSGKYDNSPALQSALLSVVTPNDTWTVVGPSGPGTPNGNRWTFETPNPMPLYAFSFAASPDYEVVSVGESKSGVEVFAAVFPESMDDAVSAFEAAIVTVDWMEEYIGPLDFGEQFALVEIPEYGGGMEHVGAIWMGSDIIADPSRGLFVTVHETVHYWWGDSVRFADWPHFWLAEGFDEWSTNYNILPEILTPEESEANILDYRIDGADASYPFFAGLPTPGPLRFGDNEDMTLHFIADLQFYYVYGAAFLEMVNRRLIRDFDTNLNTLLAIWFDQRHLTSATTEEFLGFLQGQTGNEKFWSDLFYDWVYKTPAPTLRLIDYTYENGLASFTIERAGGSNQSLTEFGILLCTADGPVTTKIDLPPGINQAIATANLTIEPDSIAMDPNQFYIFRIEQDEKWSGPSVGYFCEP